MLKLAWKPGPAADFEGPIVLSATRFTYRSAVTLPWVYWYGLSLRRAWHDAEGSLGVGISSDFATRTTYTLSAWVSEEALRRWVRSPGHAPLMGRFRGRLLSSAAHTFRAEKLDRSEAWKIGLEHVGLRR
jgi:hypothetical protein